MESYQSDKLREYIEKSELVVVGANLRLRLSKEMLENYNQGLYNAELAVMLEHVGLITDLGIKYPAAAKPIFYVYVVPTDNFRELLNLPTYRNYSAGGKAVNSYDLDGFNVAYGISENVLIGLKKQTAMRIVSNIHELAHPVHSMFFTPDVNTFLCEGFAECLPLYTMDYESVFDEHREMLKTLTDKQILSANELINLAHKNNFDAGVILPGKSCAFDISYISSYLFVRGCLEAIETKFNLDRIGATQKFLEIVKFSMCTQQYLVYDIADVLGISRDELLDGKEMQFRVIEGLSAPRTRG